jgi:hypothetical protein
MQVVPPSSIKSVTSTYSGLHCRECGQIAYRIVVVLIDEKEEKIPLCGRHYLEALRSA